MELSIGETDTKPLVVLIIEDDMVSQRILTIMLEKTYKVIEANSAQAGMASFVQYNPDVVLLDIHLPDLTGYEVLKRLKSLNNDAYIVMLSADNADEDLILAHAQGVAGFIKKPFLKEKVVEYIEKSRFLNPQGAETSATSYTKV